MSNSQHAWPIRCDNEEAMVAFGTQLGQAVQQGAVVYLEGPLGAGKTTICRGVLRAFGHTGAVKSPTYTVVEPYELSGTRLYHFDLYRLANGEELEYLGIRDYFAPAHVCLIEWPQRGNGFLPLADLSLTIDTPKLLAAQHNAQIPPQFTGRVVSVVAHTKRGETALQKLIVKTTD